MKYNNNKLILFCLIACIVSITTSEGRRAVKTFEINLDLAPEKRYEELLPTYNKTVWGFYNKYFAKDKILTDILYGLADKRGPENEEQQKEIEGLADLSKLPLKFSSKNSVVFSYSTCYCIFCKQGREERNGYS